MNLEEHFQKQNSLFSDIIKTSFDSELNAKLSNTFQFLDDLNLWQETLNKNNDVTILASAIQEFELGFQALVCGQYRYAFTAQRYFLEQMCWFIHLSTNELQLRHWKLGLKDISWAGLTDNDTGVFSKTFIRAFYSEAEEEGGHILTMVTKLYRETSEYVHGNFTKSISLPSKIEFDKETVSTWLGFMDTAKLAVLFLLFVRFGLDIENKCLHKFEAMAQDELSGINGFESLFIR